MSEFGKAFRAARSAGKKTFTWNGKSYTTKLKSETTGSVSKKVPVPTPRPEATKTDAQDAVDNATSVAKAAADAADKSPQQDFPRPAKDVGIARANSVIGQAAARVANTPVVDPKPAAMARVQAQQDEAKAQADAREKSIPPEKHGPKPEGVWYAKKGSAISKAAARRANTPSAKN